MQRFRGGLVFKANRLCVSLNYRLESNTEEKKKFDGLDVRQRLDMHLRVKQIMVSIADIKGPDSRFTNSH